MENIFKSKKLNHKEKTTSKIPFHLDDKGRKIYDVAEIINNPKTPDKIKEEINDKKSNLKGEDLIYLKSRDVTTTITNDIKIDSTIKLKLDSSIYYCKICNTSLNDNQAYLDHLNGKRHNQLIGMNMKVEKVGLDKVREKLLSLKRKSDKPIDKPKINKNLEELEKIE